MSVVLKLHACERSLARIAENVRQQPLLTVVVLCDWLNAPKTAKRGSKLKKRARARRLYPFVIRSMTRKSFLRSAATAYGNCGVEANGDAFSASISTTGWSISSTVTEPFERKIVIAGSAPSSVGIPKIRHTSRQLVKINAHIPPTKRISCSPSAPMPQ